MLENPRIQRAIKRAGTSLTIAGLSVIGIAYGGIIKDMQESSQRTQAEGFKAVPQQDLNKANLDLTIKSTTLKNSVLSGDFQKAQNTAQEIDLAQSVIDKHNSYTARLHANDNNNLEVEILGLRLNLLQLRALGILAGAYLSAGGLIANLYARRNIERIQEQESSQSQALEIVS